MSSASQQLQQEWYPTPSIEKQTAVTPDISGASEASYWLLVNDDDGLARFITGQWTYMQQNVSDPERPEGHLTIELHYRHSLTWAPPRDKIAYLQKYMLPNPAKFEWLRSCYPAGNAPNGMKRRTLSMAAGIANTGDLITYQNSVRDGNPSP